MAQIATPGVTLQAPYCLVKGFDRGKCPAFRIMSAADEFKCAPFSLMTYTREKEIRALQDAIQLLKPKGALILTDANGKNIKRDNVPVSIRSAAEWMLSPIVGGDDQDECLICHLYVLPCGFSARQRKGFVLSWLR